MGDVLKLLGVLLGVGVIASVVVAFIWDPFKTKCPKVAAGIKSAFILVIIAAVVLYEVNRYEEKENQRQAERDAEIWEEAYESGINEVINKPETYISFDEAYEEGYAAGYEDGWHDCKNGVPLENPVIAEFERTQGE